MHDGVVIRVESVLNWYDEPAKEVSITERPCSRSKHMRIMQRMISGTNVSILKTFSTTNTMRTTWRMIRSMFAITLLAIWVLEPTGAEHILWYVLFLFLSGQVRMD